MFSSRNVARASRPFNASILTALAFTFAAALVAPEAAAQDDRPSIEDVHLVEGKVSVGRCDVEHGDPALGHESVDDEAPEAPAAAGDENLVEAHGSFFWHPDRASTSMILHGRVDEFRTLHAHRLRFAPS